MCGSFCYTRLTASHLRIAVTITPNVLAGNDLVPHASGGKPTVSIIEMIAVPAHCIAQFCCSCVLDSLPAGDKLKAFPHPLPKGRGV